MDPILGCIFIMVMIILSLICLTIYKTIKKHKKSAPTTAGRAQQRAPIIVGGRRQTGARRRPVNNTESHPTNRRHPIDNNDSDDDYTGENSPSLGDNNDDDFLGDAKLGKKKAAKMQAKAEKRAQREAELEEREERRRREAERAAERKAAEERERREEREREEAERLAREEQRRQEELEYQKIKAAFSLDEEGFGQEESELDSQNMLAEFVEFVRRAKVVSTDELAGRWRLRPQEAADRLRALVASGALSGVLDDRGKFIYVSPRELENVARFIAQRGRISLAELVDYSNRLIDLDPDTKLRHNQDQEDALFVAN